MQLLISFRWIQGEADAQGITATDAEVMQSFDEQKRQSFPKEADFEKFLKNSGQTQDDILRRVKLDLLSNKIRDRVVAGAEPVTDQAIADFYAAHKTRFAEPEKRDLRIVLTKRKADAAAGPRGPGGRPVVEGRGQALLDRRHVEGLRRQAPGAVRGHAGRASSTRRSSAPARASWSGRSRRQYGYYVFTVTRVTAARQQPLAEARKTIKQTLDAEAQQKLLDAFIVDFTARWRAKTECAEGFKTTDCRNGPKPTPTPTPQPWT